MPKLKSPEIIQQENDEVTRTSLEMMEDLLESNQNIEGLLTRLVEIAEDQAGFLETLVEGLEEDEIED